MAEEKDTQEDVEEEQSLYDSMNELIAQVWYQHGLFCASHPALIIVFSSLVVLTCSAPLFSSTGFNIPATVETTTTTTMQTGNGSFLPLWFDGKPYIYVIQFVLTGKLPKAFQSLQIHGMRQALKPAFDITRIITNFKENKSGQGMANVCLNVSSGAKRSRRSGLQYQDNRFLPSSGCLLLSPANIWDKNLERFASDIDLFDDMYQLFGRQVYNILLEEFIFGTSMKETGLYPKLAGIGPEKHIRYAITLVMRKHNSRYIDALKNKLQSLYPETEQHRKEDKTSDNQVFHVFYKNDGGTLVELGPICVAYFVVFLYLAFSIAKIDMVKSKFGLAFSAVITVIASLVMAGGLSTFFGLVPTLRSSEALPYLVIMVGVENILVITKSVVSTPVDLDVKVRVAQGLSKEGRYMLKNLATEMFVIILGYFTYVPAIQEFCLFAFIGLLSDFFLQVFLFSTILSIDIRRMEMSDLDRVSFQQQVMMGHHKKTTSPRPLDSKINPPQCPVIPVKSKRLKLVNFWARTRMVQRACMVCAVMYFIYIVFYSMKPSAIGKLASDLSNQNDEEEMSWSKIIAKIVDDHDVDVNGSDVMSEQSDTIPHTKDVLSSGGWAGLTNYHWPQLLSYYNISLLGRYISILPPIHLNFKMDVPRSIPKENVPNAPPTKSFPHSPIHSPDPRHMPFNTRDPEYYMNALNCVVLGVLVMIILFFVCKYLNDLQVRPKSGSFRHGGMNYQSIVEAVPLSLKGHSQNVEHMKCTASSIVSICLSGQIRVWSRTTGECTKVIKRSGDIPPTWPRCALKRKTKMSSTGNKYSNLETTSTASLIASSLPDILPEESLAAAQLDGLDSEHTPCDDSKGRTGSVSSCLSDHSGYDFGPFCEDGSPKIKSFGSPHSLENSWSSEEEEIFDGDLDNCPNSVQDNFRTGSVWCLDCKDDILVTGCSDGVIELWSLSTGRQLCLYNRSRSGVTNVAFLMDSAMVVLSRLDGTLDFLTLLDPVSGTKNDGTPFKRASPKVQCKIPRNISSSCDSVQTHASPVHCSLTHRVRAHHQPASLMVVTKDSVVTGSHDRTLKVFRTRDAARIFTLHGHRDGITALSVLQNDPNFVISGASNGGVRVWDITTGECLLHLRGHTCSVIALACTKDNIISTSIDNSMCIWDRKKGKCLHYKLKQFPDFCSNMVMMSNDLFVTGGQGCIALWDLHRGKQIKAIPLDNGDRSVIVRNINVSDSNSIVCSYGKELRIVTFPFVMNKVE